MLNVSDTLLLYDRNYHQPNDIYLPFAENNALLKSLPTLNNQSILNFWTMDDTVILGMSDQRLVNFNTGIDFLKDQNYKLFVRNSGGLAVVTDKNVLNISLFIPRSKYNLSIDQAYQIMVDLISNTFPTSNIEAKEIIGSYCPGDFDLSINNKKFAGISQRRTSSGIVIMAYLSITGNQDKRSNLIKKFYTLSNIPKNEKYTFPDVDPNVMDNLDNLLGINLTVDDTKSLILSSLKGRTFDTNYLPEYIKTTNYNELLNTALTDLKRRNETIIF